VSGAISPGEVKKIFTDLGFKNLSIKPKEQSKEIIRGWNITKGAEDIVFSAYVQAVKPGKKILDRDRI
jgi:arsenite methyltransferase